MAHRALVAYARGDGLARADDRYDVHYAHRGAADLSLAGRLSSPLIDPVAADPLAAGVAFGAVLELVEPPVHEALYVVEARGTRAYRVLWFGPLGVDGGLLVAVDWRDPCDDDRVRAWFEGARALAAVRRERRHLSAGAAATRLARELRDWAGDREVLRCSGR